MSDQVASFHLARQHGARAWGALAHLALDRRPLRTVAGLRFVRLLGTGRGRTTSMSADLGRTAMFAVWQSNDALDAFMASSPIVSRWRAGGDYYACRLRLISDSGRWRGQEPLAGLEPVADHEGPIAVLTRAAVRPSAWLSFMRAGRPVSTAVNDADGLLAVVGIGEAPLGRQATFSLWQSTDAAEAFAYRDAHHVAVIDRTRAHRWYSEELFARFAPQTIEGTWDGIDPLAH